MSAQIPDYPVLDLQTVGIPALTRELIIPESKSDPVVTGAFYTYT